MIQFKRGLRTSFLTIVLANLCAFGAYAQICVSDYVGAEPGVIFSYGKFCGPGRPLAEQNPENIEAIRLIPAVDDFDLLCKAHDLCYAEFGADNAYCDGIFLSEQTGRANTVFTFWPDQECGNLLGEVEAAFRSFKSKRQSTSSSRIALATNVTLSPFTLLNEVDRCLAGGEFPKEAGRCRFYEQAQNDIENKIKRAVSLAAASADCDEEASSLTINGGLPQCTSSRSRQIEESLDLSVFLGVQKVPELLRDILIKGAPTEYDAAYLYYLKKENLCQVGLTARSGMNAQNQRRDPTFLVNLDTSRLDRIQVDSILLSINGRRKKNRFLAGPKIKLKSESGANIPYLSAAEVRDKSHGAAGYDRTSYSHEQLLLAFKEILTAKTLTAEMHTGMGSEEHNFPVRGIAVTLYDDAHNCGYSDAVVRSFLSQLFN